MSEKKFVRNVSKDDNVILGLDIGTFYVKAVMARKEMDDSLEILGVAKIKQRPDAMRAGVILDIPAVVSTCERLIMSLEEKVGVKAKKTVTGMAGELVKCNVSTIRYRRERPEKAMTDVEMSAILTKVQLATGKKVQKEIAFEMDNPMAQVALLNSAIVSMKIDGQKVNNPIGFKGTEVEIEFYTAFAPKMYVTAVERVCVELDLDMVATAVDAFAISRALIGNGDSVETPVLMIDIGGNNTSLSVIDGQGIRGTLTYGMGLTTCEKNIEVWLEGLNLAIEEGFAKVENIPSNVMICGGGAEVVEVQEALAVENWYDGLRFSKRPLINVIDLNELPGIHNTRNILISPVYVTAIGLIRVGEDALNAGVSERGDFFGGMSRILDKFALLRLRKK